MPLEKHKALRGLGGVVGRSSREEEAFEMRLNSFQLKATARLNCGGYFFNTHWVSGVVLGHEDASTKETDPSSMSMAHDNKNRNNNTEKWFRTFPMYESQLFGCSVCGSRNLHSHSMP